MNRRLFFQAMAGTAASSALPCTAWSIDAEQANQSKLSNNSISSAFKANSRLTPLRGYRGQDIACDGAWVEGKIPADLRGDFYRNGPGLFERGGRRYHHWFDGDGMVHAWRFGDQGVSHQARFVQTRKFAAEAKAGEFLVPAFGTAIAPKMTMHSGESMNTANTNVIRHDGRLLALWEGGSAHALDASSLHTQGIVSWSSELAGMPFSAHPKIEPDGTMWNFGTLFGKMILYHIDPQGKLQKHLSFEAPGSAMVHDFAVSQRHIIFLLSPIYFDQDLLRSGNSMVDSMVWQPKDAVKVLVVEKDDFSKRRILELPAFMVFHFGNAWEENNVIHLDFVRSDDLYNLQIAFTKMMTGDSVTEAPSTPAFLTIDLNQGKVSMETRPEVVEFPRIDPRLVGQRNRHIFYPFASATSPNRQHSGVMRLDVECGKTDCFDFGDRCIVEEHVVVPKRGSQNEGEAWLVGVGFDIPMQQSFASIFDAQNLASGPVALAHVPYWLPHCFHGNFYSSV